MCVAACAAFLTPLLQAGFDHDFGSVHKDEPEYDHLLRVLPRCFTEVMLRIANPLRPIFPTWFKGGDKVRARIDATRPVAAGCAANRMRVSHCGEPTKPPPLSECALPATSRAADMTLHARHAPISPPDRTALVCCLPQGAKAFAMFQAEMRTLLNEMKQRGEPEPEDQDIAAQLFRVMNDNPAICENRILSEIGMLFVEGFETTGGSPHPCTPHLSCVKPGSSSSSRFSSARLGMCQ